MEPTPTEAQKPSVIPATQFAITEDNGTTYACQSPDPSVIIEWLGWYIQMDGVTNVAISNTSVRLNHRDR